MRFNAVYIVQPLFYQLVVTFNYKTSEELLDLTFKLQVWNMLGDLLADMVK